MDFKVGDQIGDDYQITRVLGSGGMGKVYQVRNLVSDRLEAMKVLLPELARVPTLADRFIREIKVLASLDHPNITALRTALRLGDQVVMIMEFVEGVTLEEELRRGPVPLADGIGYFCQALSALSYAHSQGVVHRDIKPVNIMLTPRGTVKVMDFGIAKAVALEKLTRTGHPMGSVFYMSPEQVRGKAVDSRSDLYSVGVSLYEVATGRRPFEGDNEVAIMSAHLENEPLPPVVLNPRLPQGLSEVILRSLAKDPARRPQTADSFRAELERVLPTAPAEGGAAISDFRCAQALPRQEDVQPEPVPAAPGPHGSRTFKDPAQRPQTADFVSGRTGATRCQ